MSLYSFLEVALLQLIGVFSLYYLLKALMPRVIQRACVSIERWLNGGRTTRWQDVLAKRAVDTTLSSGCGVGCAACNGCGRSMRAAAPLGRNDHSSH